jgi:hypothetical protein
VFLEFVTPWRTYSFNEMDRFDLEGQVAYVAHDRTCVFIELLKQAQASTIHQASQDEIEDLWEKHRLVALLPVFKKIQSLDGIVGITSEMYVKRRIRKP